MHDPLIKDSRFKIYAYDYINNIQKFLKIFFVYARVAELADAVDSKSTECNTSYGFKSHL